MDNDLVKAGRYENYLLVEGSDDRHVFHHLLDYHKIRDKFKIKNEPFEVISHEGIDNLLNLKTLRTRLKGDTLRRLGIVVDADTDLAARWQQLRSILEGSGYHTVPKQPKSEGTIVEEAGLPVVGVWLMPDNTIPGMMEDFVGLLVPTGDLLWPMADDILQKVVERDRRFREVYQSKARLHTWLAWQKEPGTSLGLAITRRYVDAAAPHAQELINWIRKLFDLESV